MAISKRYKFFYFILVFTITTFSVACDEEDTDLVGDGGPNLTITSMDIFITDTMTKVVDTVSYQDSDGVGPFSPYIFDKITLNKSRVYEVRLRYFNEYQTDTAIEVTPSILMEAENYLVCFTSNGIGNLNVIRTDTDGNNNEIGIWSLWEAPTQPVAFANAATLKINLRYQPGIKDGRCSLGSTDFQVNFPIEVR